MNYTKPTRASMATRYPAGQTSGVSPADSQQPSRFASSLKSTASAVMLGTLRNLRDYWLAYAAAVAAPLILISAIQTALDLPEVRKSYSTQECVAVILGDGSAGSCDNLPKTYNMVWVE